MQLQCHVCGGTYGLNPLPEDPVIAEKWKEALPNATPDVFNKDFRLCVLHFDPIYVFHRRYLLKMAVPDRLTLSGENWVNENSSKPSAIASQRAGYAFAAPRMISNSMSSAVDESPVVLPLPPRREDEPDSDPLAIPDNTQVTKTPVISHVTSLRQPDSRASPETRSSPQKSNRSNNMSGGSPSSRTPTHHSNSHHHSAKSNSSHKPKITVRTPAQLSVPTTLNSSIRSAEQSPSTVTTSQFKTVRTPQGIPISKQVHTITVSQQPQGLHHSPDQGSSPTPALHHNMVQGTPVYVPDPNHSTPLVQNQSKLFVIENPRSLNTQATDAISKSKTKFRRLHPKKAEVTSRSGRPQPTAEHIAAIERKLPASRMDVCLASAGMPTQSPASSADKAKYTERMVKQAIARTRADIEKSRLKSRSLRKKVELLKMKVSTYEELIAKLVGKNIISTESAKLCRVLEKDIVRYNKRRKSAPYATTNSFNTNSLDKGLSDHSKENSNDSVDLTSSKDHDYLQR